MFAGTFEAVALGFGNENSEFSIDEVVFLTKTNRIPRVFVMNNYSLTYCVPFRLPEAERARITTAIETMFGIRTEKSDVLDWSWAFAGGHLRTTRSAWEIVDDFVAISPQVRVFVMPRNDDEEWTCNPPFFRTQVAEIVKALKGQDSRLLRCVQSEFEDAL